MSKHDENVLGERVLLEAKEIKLSKDENSKLVPGCTLTFGHGNNSIVLGENLDCGGQGKIYNCSRPNYVVKIYSDKERTTYIEEKIKYIISKKLKIKHVCWPEEALYLGDKFVGYLMPRVRGNTLKSITGNARGIKRRFADLNREKQLKLLVKVVDILDELHQSDILVSDLKSQNIMFDDKLNVTFIDTDSFQIDNYICPVTTKEYDSPEVMQCIGENKCTSKAQDGTYNYLAYYGSRKRTKFMEYYALTVFIFSILMLGSAPYAVSFYENTESDDFDEEIRRCVNRDFAFKTEEKGFFLNLDENRIWSHFPYFLKQMFVNTFHRESRYAPAYWGDVLRFYLDLLKTGKLKDDNEANSIAPSEPIAFDKVLVKYTHKFEHFGFSLKETVYKIIKDIKNNKELNKHAEAIWRKLRNVKSVDCGSYRFKLVYNLGFLNKVTCEKVFDE